MKLTFSRGHYNRNADGNDSFVFKYAVTGKQRISKFTIIFFEINVKFCLLCAHHVMKCIIIHSRRPVNKITVTHLVFMFQQTFIFRILRS